MTATMIPLPAPWLAAENDYVPHYSHTQEITGIAVLAAIVVVAVVAFLVIQSRRRR